MLIWKTQNETAESSKKKERKLIQKKKEMAERTTKEKRFLCHFQILRIECISV